MQTRLGWSAVTPQRYFRAQKWTQCT